MDKNSSEQIDLSSIDKFVITEYRAGASAYQSPNNPKSWSFVIEVLSGKKQYFEFQGKREYDTEKDALMDAYGVLEYLGYECKKNKRICFSVYSWDDNNQKYINNYIYFDGYDFYNKNTKTKKS